MTSTIVGLILNFFLSGFSNSEKTCDKEFIIRRAATNRVLNVLRHWVSKHSQVSPQPLKSYISINLYDLINRTFSILSKQGRF